MADRRRRVRPHSRTDLGLGLGLGYTVLSIIQNILMFTGQQQVSTLLSMLVLPFAIGLLVCFILFWVLDVPVRQATA